MAQHIGIVEINESGAVLKHSDVNYALISNILFGVDKYKDKFPWLSTIDEYGDTIFNYLQLPYVCTELTELGKSVNDDTAKSTIEEILVFVDNTETHKYIKFIGD